MLEIMAIDKIKPQGKTRSPQMDVPKVARKAVKMLCEGKNQSEIADAIGVNRATVSRWVNRAEIREWIDKQAEKYIESLPDALELSKDVLTIGSHQTNNAINRSESGEVISVDTSKIDQKILDLALKESERLRQAVGITPSNSNSVVIGQLILGNQQNVLMPNVQALLDKQLGDILDITPEGDAT